MTVAVAPPRRRVHKVDLNEHVASYATVFNRRHHAMLADDREYIAEVRKAFAAIRPEYGLGQQVQSLTQLTFPKERPTNAKIAKNELPTLSLTISSHEAGRRDLDGKIVVLNTCPWAGACAAVCVLSHGRGRWDHVKAARSWRTACLHSDPIGFLALLRHEILRTADRDIGPFLARLNVNSDLPWHLIPELFEGVPIQAYDYTKDPSVLDGDGWVIPGKYRKIYSWNETSNALDVARFLDRGGSVAMVTNRKKGQPVHDGIVIDRFGGFPVVDGDQSDNRFDTPRGVIVDLYAKGNARNRKTAFVQEVY